MADQLEQRRAEGGPPARPPSLAVRALRYLPIPSDTAGARGVHRSPVGSREGSASKLQCSECSYGCEAPPQCDQSRRDGARGLRGSRPDRDHRAAPQTVQVVRVPKPPNKNAWPQASASLRSAYRGSPGQGRRRSRPVPCQPHSRGGCQVCARPLGTRTASRTATQTRGLTGTPGSCDRLRSRAARSGQPGAVPILTAIRIQGQRLRRRALPTAAAVTGVRPSGVTRPADERVRIVGERPQVLPRPGRDGPGARQDNAVALAVRVTWLIPEQAVVRPTHANECCWGIRLRVKG
jgi:hypothetical protein